MSEHTPEPWHVKEGYSTFQVWTADEQHPIADTFTLTIHADQAEANARLIAAAPDLLDACGQMLYGLRAKDYNELKNGMESARLAIAKAEGREPNG